MNQAELRLRAALEARCLEMSELLATLVRIPSHATQTSGVRQVADRVGSELAEAGFSVEPEELPPLPDEMDWVRDLMLPGSDYGVVAPALVARRSGKGRHRLLLLGDLDTSYGPGAFERFPFHIDGDRAYGPGIADMKGGLVVLTAALRAVHDVGVTIPAAVTVVLSPDEQAGSLRSRTLIEREAARCDWCLCLECARDGGNLMGSRAHIGVARLDVFGRESHAGTRHTEGISAIEALARKIPRINALTDPARGIYVTVGQIQGGRRRSVVPGSATCTIDVRTPNAGAWQETETALQRIAATVDIPGSTADLRIYAHRPAVPWTAGTDQLIAVARAAGDAAGIPFGVIRSSAAGSSAFAGAMGIPTLDGMGPLGGDLMTDREYIEIPSLVDRALLLALTLHLLSR